MCCEIKAIIITGNVSTSGKSSIQYCSNLQCIYFYDSTSVEASAFYDTLVTTIMTLDTYENETIGEMNVTKGTTIDECLPPKYTFTESIQCLFRVV